MRSPDSPTALHKLTGSLLWGLLLVLVCLGSASSDANTPPPGQLVASFVYNPSGLRIEKQGERGVERFTYDEQSLLQAYDENNTTLAKYDYGAERLVSLTSSSEPVQFYLTDALNSVVNLTNTAGSVQARYQYDAFGNQRAQSGSSYNRFAFTGYVEDKETDLLYAKARYYDSDTGRFLSQDAWEGQNDLPPSLHKYLYAYQNPTVWVDPTGHAPVTLEAKEAAFEAAEMHMEEARQKDNFISATPKAVLAGAELLLGGILAGGDFAANNVISAGKAFMDPQVVRDAEQERDKSFGAIQGIVENPKGFASTVADSVSSNVEGMINGDVSSYVNVVSTATSFAGGAKPNASMGQVVNSAAQATSRVINTATQTAYKIPKVVEATSQAAGNALRTVRGNIVRSLTEPGPGPYARQVGAVGGDIKPSEVVRRISAKSDDISVPKGVTNESRALTPYHPPNNGALGESAPFSLLPGTRVDRYGRDAGRYLSPEGTPMEMRALASTDAPRAYSVFEVKTPFIVEASTIAPAYGQLGLGLQYYTDRAISDLLRGGYLTRIQP
jgi:RHS repeat-associated protein